MKKQEIIDKLEEIADVLNDAIADIDKLQEIQKIIMRRIKALENRELQDD